MWELMRRPGCMQNPPVAHADSCNSRPSTYAVQRLAAKEQCRAGHVQHMPACTVITCVTAAVLVLSGILHACRCYT